MGLFDKMFGRGDNKGRSDQRPSGMPAGFDFEDIAELFGPAGPSSGSRRMGILIGPNGPRVVNDNEIDELLSGGMFAEAMGGGRGRGAGIPADFLDRDPELSDLYGMDALGEAGFGDGDSEIMELLNMDSDDAVDMSDIAQREAGLRVIREEQLGAADARNTKLEAAVRQLLEDKQNLRRQLREAQAAVREEQEDHRRCDAAKEEHDRQNEAVLEGVQEDLSSYRRTGISMSSIVRRLVAEINRGDLLPGEQADVLVERLEQVLDSYADGTARVLREQFYRRNGVYPSETFEPRATQRARIKEEERAAAAVATDTTDVAENTDRVETGNGADQGEAHTVVSEAEEGEVNNGVAGVTNSDDPNVAVTSSAAAAQ